MTEHEDGRVLYRQRPELTARPVPEAETCIVYCADNPRLYSLNLAAWLVFELCRGRTSAEIIAAYTELTVPPLSIQQAEGQAAEGLAQLLHSQLIEAQTTTPEAALTKG